MVQLAVKERACTLQVTADEANVLLCAVDVCLAASLAAVDSSKIFSLLKTSVTVKDLCLLRGLRRRTADH